MTSIKKLTKFLQNTEYSPYDDNLPDVFNQIKLIIQDKLPAIKVEHIGSSSIPGIGGRNVIDIAIPSIDSEQDYIKSKLYNIGFEDSPWTHYIPLMVGSIDYKDKNYSILLYVISANSDIYDGWIEYRNYMLTHPEDARQYDQTKQNIIQSGKTESSQYQESKTPFILSMIKKIKNK